jgi:tetratricopeptide (TPR) repeat protein
VLRKRLKRSSRSNLVLGKILLVHVLGVAACAAATGPFNYQAVEAGIASHDFAGARNKLEARLRSAPADARAHLLLGIVLAETANLNGAEQHLREAARLNPADPAAFVNLGKLLAARGERAAGAKELQAALDQDPRSVAAHLNLGLIQIAEKQFGQAEVHLQKAAALAPADISIRMALLQAQLGSKRLPAAKNTATEILAIAPSQAEALQMIGALEAQAGDYPEAIRNLEKASSLAPDSYEVRYNLGLAYHHSGDGRHALGVLEPLAMRNSSAELANLLGSVYEGNGKYLEAVKSFQRAAESEPANEDYRFDYTWELLEHRSFEPARLVAEPAVHDFPSSMRMKLALGVAWFGLQRFREAQELFVATAKQFPDSDLPLYYVTLAPDTSELAIPETKALLTAQHLHFPHRFLPLYLLGHVELRDGNAMLAAEVLQESVRLQPNHAQARYELGRAYAELSRFHEAIAQYEASVHLQPDLAEAWYRLYLAAHSSGDADRATHAERMFRKLQQETEKQDAIHSFVYSMRQ